jgi:hypothetical protein
MTAWEVFWNSVAGGALGCAVVLAFAVVAERLVHKRAERNEARARDEHNTKVENGDESVDEGKLRVAVRRSVEDPEVAARRRQEHLDAAAVRRGEETRPIATIRREMMRVMLCEPPMVDGVTLFAYLKHHAQPSGLAWDSEDMGALANVTQALYDGVQRDPLVAPVFEPYDLERRARRRDGRRARAGAPPLADPARAVRRGDRALRASAEGRASAAGVRGRARAALPGRVRAAGADRDSGRGGVTR